MCVCLCLSKNQHPRHAAKVTIVLPSMRRHPLNVEIASLLDHITLSMLMRCDKIPQLIDVVRLRARTARFRTLRMRMDDLTAACGVEESACCCW